MSNQELANPTATVIAEIPAITSFSYTSLLGIKTELPLYETVVDKPPKLSAEADATLTSLRKNTHATISWASGIATDLVNKRLEAKTLPPGDLNAESSYRTKVMNSVIRDRAQGWLALQAETPITLKSDNQKSEYKSDTLLKELKSLNPAPPLPAVEKFAQRIGGLVGKGEVGYEIATHYWLAVVILKYDAKIKHFSALLQIFDITLKATTYLEGGNGAEMLKLEWGGSAVQFEFNNKRYEEIHPKGVPQITQ